MKSGGGSARATPSAWLASRRRDTVDGFRYDLEDGGWLLIRFSGTEPLMRIYTEVSKPDLVSRLLEAGRELAGVPIAGAHEGG